MMKKLLFLLALLTVTTASIQADIVIRCNQSGVSFDDKQIVIEGVYYEFHPAGDMFIEYLAGNPTAINISGGYFEVVGHDESLPAEVNLREKIEPYREDDKKFFSAYYEKQTGDDQIQKTPLNIKFNKSNTDFSSDFFFPVTSIGEKAFYGCSGLTSVTIPNSVTNIGNHAFSFCSDLTSVTIPNSVTYIGEYAFSWCSSLTSVTIPNSVTYIGEKAFMGCGLTSVIVENGNSVFDSRENCNAIIKTASNTLISGCMNTVIPNSVTSIGNDAFYSCKGLTSVTIPNTVTSIGYSAFSRCSGLTSVTIPSSVTSIRSSAFSNCSGLTSVTIPKSVTTIGEFAFYHCSGLTSVTIPNSVTTIGDGAFAGCNGPMIVEKGNCVYDSRDNCNAIIETASNTLIAGCMNTVIPKSVTSIGNYAFDGCSGLTSVTIPNSVTNIGKFAFSYCSDLTSVTIPNSVTSIGNLAFHLCRSLTSVTIPNSVTYIGEFAFEQCSSLTSVTIPNSVTSIGMCAFYDCSTLTSVTSLIEEPFEIDEDVFTLYNFGNEGLFTSATLYVPAGCKKKYEATPCWNKFEHIVEMDIAPVDDGQNVDFNTEIDEDTNLDGNIVGDIYYSISNGNGSYNTAEGCLVVTKPTVDSDIEGKDIFGEDFKAGYTGIVFKLTPGKGTIKVVAETQGNMVMKVKIGDGDPLEIDFEGKMKVSVPYNVSEASLVYIYGGMGSAGAKATGGTRASADDDLLKIYGFEVVSDASGIEDAESKMQNDEDAPVYNLNGQRVKAPARGVYIKNGRKVLVK